jgi:plastocyanin
MATIQRALIVATIASAVLTGLLGTGLALAADQSVAIGGFAYSPATVTINVGDTVTWENGDAVAHTATGGSFDTGNIAAAASASITFDSAGTFPYACTMHPFMTGTVVAETAAATPTPTPRPAATNPPAAATNAPGVGPAATPPATDAPPPNRSSGSPTSPLLVAIVLISTALTAFVVAARRRRIG